MEKLDYNQKAINDVYKNAHIALQSIKDLLPQVDDVELKNELREQYEGYDKFIGIMHTVKIWNNPLSNFFRCTVKSIDRF